MKTLSILVLLCGLLAVPRAFAVKSEWSTDHSFEDFTAGDAKQIQVTQDGILKLGPAMVKWVSFQDSTVWDVESDRQGGYYVSVGNEGKIYHVDSGGKSKLFHQTKELNVFAMAVDAEGNLFAGSSPDGKVYKISKDGKSEVWFEPGQKYIWALELDSAGSLYAGTGEKGLLYRITHKSLGEVIYDSDEKHIRALFFDSKKRLWAGSEPGGILYRFDSPETTSPSVRVIYESKFKEVRAFTEDDEANVYATIMGDGKSKGKAAKPVGTTKDIFEGLKDALKDVDANASMAAGDTGGGGGERPRKHTHDTGEESSELVRVTPSDEVEYWGSDTDGMYALAPMTDGKIWVGTADQAKFYEVNGKRQFTFMGQPDAGEAVRILTTSAKTGIAILATSHPAALWRVSETSAKSGEFVSDVIDAQVFSRWGRVESAGNTEGIQWSTRTGNTSEPDKSWSAWAETKDGKIQSKPSRYLEYKLTMSSAKNFVDEVRVYYLPFNQRPVMMGVQINPSGIELAKLTRPDAPPMLGGFANSGQKSSKSAAATDLGNALAGLAGGGMGGSSMMPVRKPGARSASWQAKDPNNDTLSYDVSYRASGETTWKLLEKDLKDNFTTWDSSAWPDGEYFLKVQVSDAPSNPKGEAKTDEMNSDIFLVDNTAPSVEGNAFGDEVKFTARDASSIIKYAEISIDGSDWRPVLADDGILDEKEENFTVVTKDLKPGSHYVILRVKDQADNESSVTVKFKK